MTGSRGNAAPDVINRSKIEKGIPEGMPFFMISQCAGRGAVLLEGSALEGQASSSR